jgi:alcohol dehydrogenase (NADP+)
MQEMLDFCAEHDVHPEIEVPGYINAAYYRMLVSDVRYRFVIDTQPLRA